MNPPESLRVLLVDDDRRVLQSIRRRVRRRHRDWRLHEAASAADAMGILHREATDIDVAVCDVQMPMVSGVELMQLIEGMYPWIIRISLSGMLDGRSLVGCGKHAQRHLCKPIPIDSLCDEILDLHRTRQADRSAGFSPR